MATRTAGAPTTKQMMHDRLSRLAVTNWCEAALKNDVQFKLEIVENIFTKDISKSNFNTKRIMLLEFSQYLENYLWPNYTPENSNHAYVMSIVCIVNVKYREAVPAWEAFRNKPEHFGHFFNCVMKSVMDDSIDLKQKTILIVFLDHCYNSLEVDVVRQEVQKTITIAMWQCLMPSRLQAELKKSAKLSKVWKSVLKRILKPMKLQKRKTILIEHFYKI